MPQKLSDVRCLMELVVITQTYVRQFNLQAQSRENLESTSRWIYTKVNASQMSTPKPKKGINLNVVGSESNNDY